LLTVLIKVDFFLFEGIVFQPQKNKGRARICYGIQNQDVRNAIHICWFSPSSRQAAALFAVLSVHLHHFETVVKMQTQHLSEQEIVRREKLAELQKLGVDPYPAALYPVNTYSAVIKSSFSDEKKEGLADVCLAGRIMSVRDMGKASFAELQDAQGRIQIYVRKDDLARDGDTSMYDQVWKKLLDIGACQGADLSCQIFTAIAYSKRSGRAGF
jgi:hypothetical protein